MNLRFIVDLQTIRERGSRGPQYRIFMSDGTVYHTELGNPVAYEVVIPSVRRLPVEFTFNHKGEITGITTEQLPENRLQWRQIKPEDISPETKLEIADDGEYIYLRNGAGNTKTDPIIVMPPGDFAGNSVGQEVGPNVGNQSEAGSAISPAKSSAQWWADVRAKGRRIREEAARGLDPDCLPEELWNDSPPSSDRGEHSMGVPGCDECEKYTQWVRGREPI